MDTNIKASCRRAAVGALAVVAFGGAYVVASPTTAAAEGTYTVTGDGSAVRQQANTSSGVIARLNNGARVVIDCQVIGQSVSMQGRGTSSVWDHLKAYNGFISDLLIKETAYAQRDPNLPTCGSTTTTGRTWGRTESSNTGYAGQCTWGAKEQFRNATGVYPAIYGNAWEWAASARNAGWTVVDDAQTRSIVVFQPGVQGSKSAGHVAWVESVERRSDGLYVHILEMNGPAGPYNWDRRVLKDVAGMSYILAP